MIPKNSIHSIDLIKSIKNKISNQESFSYLNKLRRLITSGSLLNFYDEYMKFFCGNSIMNSELNQSLKHSRSSECFLKSKNIIDLAMYSDTMNYLPDDILTKGKNMSS